MSYKIPISAQELLSKAFLIRATAGRQKRARLLERQARQFAYPDFTPKLYARHLLACAKRCATWASYAWLDREFFIPVEHYAAGSGIMAELWAMRSYTAAMQDDFDTARTALKQAECWVGDDDSAEARLGATSLILVEQHLDVVRKTILANLPREE